MTDGVAGKTKIFASWSGEPSKSVAHELAWFIEKLLQTTSVWFSPESIELGEPWPLRIAEALEETSYGFAVITGENKDSVWVHYEGGAIAGKLRSGRFAPLLFDVAISDIAESPLRYLQAAEWGKSAIWRLITEINRLLGPFERQESALKEDFEEAWPKLEMKISAALPTKSQRKKAPRESTDAKIQRIENLVRDVHARTIAMQEDAEKQRLRAFSPFAALGETPPDDSNSVWITVPPQGGSVRVRRSLADLLGEGLSRAEAENEKKKSDQGD